MGQRRKAVGDKPPNRGILSHSVCVHPSRFGEKQYSLGRGKGGSSQAVPRRGVLKRDFCLSSLG